MVLGLASFGEEQKMVYKELQAKLIVTEQRPQRQFSPR